MKTQFTQPEIDIIRDWFDTATKTSGKHLGTVEILFPSERILLNKVTAANQIIELDHSEIELLYEIMHKSVSKRYGNSTYLFGFEQQLYNKIENAFHDKDF